MLHGRTGGGGIWRSVSDAPMRGTVGPAVNGLLAVVRDLGARPCLGWGRSAVPTRLTSTGGRTNGTDVVRSADDDLGLKIMT